MNYVNIKKCRVCGQKELTEAIRFAPQFLSPTFVKTNKRNKLADIKVPLTVVVCDKSKNPACCGLVQLKETTDHDLLYKDYFYRSSTNDTMKKDLKDVVMSVLKKAKPKKGDVVVDIGSNDGTMISYFPKSLVRIGVEPAKNITWDHLDPSITVVNDYFSKKALVKTLGERTIKILTSCAMFYDLDEPNLFVADAASVLAPEGVWCIQLSYALSMLENMNFYDICHEHLEYYSLETLNHLMERNGLTIFDAELNEVNGGSARVFITHTARKLKKSASLVKLLARERRFKLADPATYVAFDKKIRSLAVTVRDYLKKEIKAGHNVIGLGASTKGNVLLQLFGINKTMLPYISEIQVAKIGLRTLGTDIELISDEAANKLNPSTKLVLPWYFKKEIVKREKPYLAQGGTLLFPMPYAHIVSKKGETKLR
ncbi:MAG: methyltransferase domain-containing protein [bacterium]|nr:methyltransferase domain-containing protein [bacterium]